MTKITVILGQESFFDIQKWEHAPLPTSEAGWIFENREWLCEK